VVTRTIYAVIEKQAPWNAPLSSAPEAENAPQQTRISSSNKVRLALNNGLNPQRLSSSARQELTFNPKNPVF
jgi:hypothetical protein